MPWRASAVRSQAGCLAADARPYVMPEPNEAGCAEEKRLFAQLRHTLGSLVEIQRSHMDALAVGDGQVSRFEEEIRIALSAWQNARYSYMRHISDHGCRSSKDPI